MLNGTRGAKSWFQKLPTFNQWLRLPRVLSRGEKIIFFILFLVFLSSASFLLRSFYLARTTIGPAKGGTLEEGIVGHPRFINPILASSDPDRDLVQLTFSGLMKYNEKGEIVEDLIEEYYPQEEKGIYDVTLRKDIFWSDGQPITAHDVVFTVETIKNSSYKSPERTNWIGVNVKALSDKRIRFELQKPYFPFKERLTLKIIPKHIFENVTAKEFALSPYNLQQVICSGPFVISHIEQDEKGKITELVLVKNKKFYGKDPYLDKIHLSFFDEEKEAWDALNKGVIESFLITDPSKNKEITKKGLTIHTARSPRYFGIFFNLENNELLKKEGVRKALFSVLDKKAVKEQAIDGWGETVLSPILPTLYEFDLPAQEEAEDAIALLEEAGLTKEEEKWVVKPEPEFIFENRLEKGDEGEEVESLQKCLGKWEDVYPDKEVTGYFGSKTEEAVIKFQEKYKEDILAPWDFTEGTGIVSETTREKLNELCNEEKGTPVKFTIKTLNQDFLVKTAEAIKSQWEEFGVEVEVEKYKFSQLTLEVINERDYEILLFGEMLGMIPDPFSFWHSSNISNSGLNLSLYKNEETDKFLEEARAADNYEKFREQLFKFQEQFTKDRPAILLFSPELSYAVDNRIKGVDLNIVAGPTQRFHNIEEWYINTKRSFK